MVQVIVETLFFFHPAIWWLSSRMRVEREHCCDLARWALARRPLLVGVVHGLEGSGTLTALVMANSSTLSAQIAYIAVFGLGSILGMTALSSCALWPMARFVRRPMTV